MGARERACGEQERKRRNGYSGLFDEDPSEQNDIAMMQEEFDDAMHWPRLGPL
jgi:hypothetical protein